MSEFTPISKKRIKVLEETSTHYLNTIGQYNMYDDPSIVHNFHNWSNDALDGSAGPDDIFHKGLYEKVKYISSKLGMEQAYYVNYSGLRNAVWGFEYEGNEYILYFSNEGLSLQSEEHATGDDVIETLRETTKKWRA